MSSEERKPMFRRLQKQQEPAKYVETEQERQAKQAAWDASEFAVPDIVFSGPEPEWWHAYDTHYGFEVTADSIPPRVITVTVCPGCADGMVRLHITLTDYDGGVTTVLNNFEIDEYRRDNGCIDTHLVKTSKKLNQELMRLTRRWLHGPIQIENLNEHLGLARERRELEQEEAEWLVDQADIAREIADAAEKAADQVEQKATESPHHVLH